MVEIIHYLLSPCYSYVLTLREDSLLVREGAFGSPFLKQKKQKLNMMISAMRQAILLQ